MGAGSGITEVKRNFCRDRCEYCEELEYSVQSDASRIPVVIVSTF